MKKGLLLILSVIISLNICAQDAPKREFRGGWLHIVGNNSIKDMSRAEVQDWFTEALDSMQVNGCNAVIFQVRPCADAFYKSEIEPWSRYLSGTQGVAPAEEWDPLQFMVDESHKRGMEIHAWCNPYRVTLTESDELCESHVYHKHPEIFVKYGKQLYFNPAEPLSRELTVKAIADIVNRYDVEAVHFDDYFYPYPIKDQVFNDSLAFEKYAAEQGFVVENPEQRDSIVGDWRRYNVELLIKDLNDTIKTLKPWVRFGISPFGIHRNKRNAPDGSETNGLSNYDELFADVPRWAELGIIDYVVPQLYWEIGHRAACYDVLIHWWNDYMKRGHLYIGQSMSSFRKPDLKDSTKNQTEEKMRLVRELPNVNGNVWWPAWSFLRNVSNLQTDLKENYQKYHALVPVYEELDNQAPAAAINFTSKGAVLSWDQAEADKNDPMQKVLFYGVYCFPRGVEVDINNPAYLVKRTQETQFDALKENPNHKSGSKYVVTVIDRCWNESEPTEVITLKYTDHYYKRYAQFEAEEEISSEDIVMLGDSLTEGGKWDEYFAEKIPEGTRIINRGIIGDDAPGIYDRLEQILPYQPRKIFFLCGINDISHNLSTEKILSDIEKVVSKIRTESPDTKLYIQSLLPYNQEKSIYKSLNGKFEQVSEVNDGLKKMAKKYGAKYINHHKKFTDKKSKELRADLTRDGLHINQDGYAIWAKAISKYVK